MTLVRVNGELSVSYEFTVQQVYRRLKLVWVDKAGLKIQTESCVTKRLLRIFSRNGISDDVARQTTTGTSIATGYEIPHILHH